jgi:hypothetical protein
MPSIQQLVNPKSLFSSSKSSNKEASQAPAVSNTNTRQTASSDSLKMSSSSSLTSNSSKSAASSINEEIKQKFQSNSIFKNGNQQQKNGNFIDVI